MLCLSYAQEIFYWQMFFWVSDFVCFVFGAVRKKKRAFSGYASTGRSQTFAS